MSRVAQVVLLCEDLQQQVFFYRLLKRLGYSRRAIYLRAFPQGRQSAEQFVREKFAEEVHAFRNTHVSRCLVVAIDADTHAVGDRQQQLDAELTGHGYTSRRPDEPIVIFIPKRNIETWIKYLLEGGEIDETVAYAKYVKCERECQPAVERFLELFTQFAIPDDCPPSLQQGFIEAKRVPK